MDADYVLSHVAPEMSVRGTSRATIETKIINYFQDFLQEMECGGGLCIIIYSDLEPHCGWRNKKENFSFF